MSGDRSDTFLQSARDRATDNDEMCDVPIENTSETSGVLVSRFAGSRRVSLRDHEERRDSSDGVRVNDNSLVTRLCGAIGFVFSFCAPVLVISLFRLAIIVCLAVTRGGTRGKKPKVKKNRYSEYFLAIATDDARFLHRRSVRFSSNRRRTTNKNDKRDNATPGVFARGQRKSRARTRCS